MPVVSRSVSPATGSVFRRLLAAMLAFGGAVGVAFPFAVGATLQTERAYSASFFAMSVAAGLAVGAVNYALFHVVVSRVIQRLAAVMGGVVEHVVRAKEAKDMCPEGCLLEVTSADAVGEVERAFNTMTAAIADRIRLDAQVREMLHALTQSVELEQVARRLVEVAAGACGSPGGLLYLDTGTELELKVRYGFDDSDALPKTLDSRQGLAEAALSAGEVTVLRAGEWSWATLSTPLSTLRPSGMVLVPLRAEQRVVGLILVPLTDLSELPLDFLRTVCLQGGPHLQNAWLHHKLANMAAIDDLTQLLNRRFGLRRLREEFQRSLRHGVPVAVMMLDVDHFKRFNDDFGHDAGDEVLRKVARVFEASVRVGDVVCRYGGEEFLVMAPGAGLQDAAVVAERIRRQVEGTELRFGQHMTRITVSVGVAVWPLVSCSSVEELITAADAAVYEAKHLGRNRVEAYRPAGGPAKD
ncbi:MAG: GGDEF domain-containing protein [Deltaproteobacteria bacterium]|nr:GGDEF domain-containing protein [Deltaproteobacteria bacterium]